ncbi:EamA family transporter [Nocardioides sp. Kera G14]|uniref:EamA family transporter n=1 Tax=Nocardioides sp. Kera G14 TaxID=2884264 RepID=UPI001D129A1C|nr:EamA family transporter [Nocardioides sp. Kera G14]UDY24538.1 EamA family transporter [Nocardioides sp. Kera G14]
MPAAPRSLGPVGLVILGVVSVQLGAAIGKSLFDEISPTTVVWLRLATSTVVLLAWARPTIRGRRWPDLWPVLALGVTLGAMNWAIYQSFERIPLGIAITIELAGPLTLAVLKSHRPADLIWIGLAAVGVALLGFEPGDLTVAGVLFAVAAGALWATYILLTARIGRAWSGVDGLAIASAVALLCLSPVLVGGGHLGDLGSTRIWLIGAAVGLLSSVVPYSAEMFALRSLSPVIFGVLVSLDPAAAALAAFAVIGESLSLLQWLAIACVVAASVGMTRSGRETLVD